MKIEWRISLLANKNKYRVCIPKIYFPRVFKNSLDNLNIDDCASKYLIAGIKSTGIYLLDGNKIFSRILTLRKDFIESTNSEANESSWCESFKEFLADSRVKETSNLRKNKRKKISTRKEHYFKSRPK